MAEFNEKIRIGMNNEHANYSQTTLSISNRKYFFTMIIPFLLVIQGLFSIYQTLTQGLGIWGINDTYNWALDITNFVFWIGIAHAGTLISSILFLLRQEWRRSFNRTAEITTIVALMCAAFFPVIHTGRPWFALYWMMPYPNEMGLIQNFISPLVWDFFAISSYFVVSSLFLYMGLIPDFNIMKQAKYKIGIIKSRTSYASLGWYGSEQQWRSYRSAYSIFAGLLAPLVISVHTIVSYDFAVTLLPGWHSTIFPPYYVAGAILSGLAFINVLIIPLTKIVNVKDLIKPDHFDKINKLILAFSLIVGFVYLTELFFSFYSLNKYEGLLINEKTGGGLSGIFILVIILNVIIPQLYFFKSIRNMKIISFFISLLIIIGMWLERYMIIVGSLGISIINSTQIKYCPTATEISLFLFSIGLFMTLFLMIIRWIPFISLHENGLSSDGK
jgi:Ni/Fe-hydrogenase subunit HybB-like protein